MMTYYGIEIDYEDGIYSYSICGWIYETQSLEEAQKDIRANYRQDAYYWSVI